MRLRRSSRRCRKIRAFPPSSCPPVRTSTRACPCSPGRCASRMALTPRASPPYRSKPIGGRVKVSAVDDTVQEGARRFVFDGNGPATVADHERRRGRCVARIEWRRHVAGAPAPRRRCAEGRDARHEPAARVAAARCRSRTRSAACLPASGRPSACRSSASPKAGVDVSKVNETLIDRVGEQARPVDLAGQARHRGRQDRTPATNGVRPRFLANGARPDADEEGALAERPFSFQIANRHEAGPFARKRGLTPFQRS